MESIHDIRPGVAVVIFNKENRVLLQKRAHVELWGIPSGHVEPGETVTNAAIREVFEETGLLVRVTRLIGIYSDPLSQVFHYPDGRKVHFVTACFQAEVEGGQISLDSPETLDIRYFPCDELPCELLPMHPQWLEDALSSEGAPFVR